MTRTKEKPLWSETRDGKRKLAVLAAYLPPGFAGLFTARLTGRYAGLVIMCPTCGATAPAEYLYASRKWRWLAVHQAKAHGPHRRNP